jgi:hypothetical protein
MNKDFISYEQALALKELKFDEPCLGWWSTTTPNIELMIEEVFPGEFKTSTLLAPLYQQAFRWFREKYKLFGCIDLHISTPTHWYIRIDDIIKNDYMYHSEDENLKYNTYEEAELACLDKLIEIVKSK